MMHDGCGKHCQAKAAASALSPLGPGISFGAVGLGARAQVLHPAAEIMQPVSLLAPHPGPRPHAQLPAVRLMREEVGGAGRGSRRLHVELRLPAAGAFGSMNVSGPVAGWSLPPGALQVGTL